MLHSISSISSTSSRFDCFWRLALIVDNPVSLAEPWCASKPVGRGTGICDGLLANDGCPLDFGVPRKVPLDDMAI
jgi:hypothetical protein